MTRILVCGDREWWDRNYIFDRLDEFHELYGISTIIEGCARGADRVAGWPCPLPDALWDRPDTYFTRKRNHRHRDGEVHAEEAGECRKPVIYAPLGWARERGIPVEHYPADWDQFQKRAGYIRNQQMLDEGKPHLVVAFHSNLQDSKGTRNMVEIARKAGVDTHVFPNSHEG